MAAALRELCIGLCKGNYLMHRASLGGLAGVAIAGWGFHPGADRPVEDVYSGVLGADPCFPCLLDFAALSSLCTMMLN
jgi:hypothetical protein